jgi:hypothetical protein
MKSTNEIDLTEATQAFAVANTPLFLVRKLRADEAVRSLARELGEQELLEGLRLSIAEQPRDLTSAVRPYALLVALSLKLQADGIKKAAEISAPNWEWFDYISNYLSTSFHPVQSTRIVLSTQSQSMEHVLLQRSMIPTDEKKIYLPGS